MGVWIPFWSCAMGLQVNLARLNPVQQEMLIREKIHRFSTSGKYVTPVRPMTSMQPANPTREYPWQTSMQRTQKQCVPGYAGHVHQTINTFGQTPFQADRSHHVRATSHDP